MNDKQFRSLQLKVRIVPSQDSWPAPELRHWHELHKVADTARNMVGQVFAQMETIDRNSDLSQEGKARQRVKAAIDAIAELETDKTLIRAREAVDDVMTKWREKQGAVIKKPIDQHEVSLHREIRQDLKEITDPIARMKWIQEHAGDPMVVSALLSAPAFLSRMTEVELTKVREKAEAHLDPIIVEAREMTRKAMTEAEVGWSKAIKLIAEKGGLVKDSTGAWSTPKAAA